MPRSGTTWVGRMLAASGELVYVTEPFNPEWPGILRMPVTRWFQYVCEENESEYARVLQESARLEPHVLAELRSVRNLVDPFRVARWTGTALRGRLRGAEALFKDPFAVFSAEWFTRRLNCRAVVVVRHPYGILSSLKRLNWSFELSELYSQPLLMRDYLGKFKSEMMNIDSEDVLDTQSLLWRLIYQTASQMAQGSEDMTFVRHEDLAASPLEQYRNLYDQLGLQFNARAQAVVDAASRSGNPKSLAPNKTHSTRMDSVASLENWKSILTPAEVERIDKRVGAFAQHLYPNDRERERFGAP